MNTYDKIKGISKMIKTKEFLEGYRILPNILLGKEK